MFFNLCFPATFSSSSSSQWDVYLVFFSPLHHRLKLFAYFPSLDKKGYIQFYHGIAQPYTTFTLDWDQGSQLVCDDLCQPRKMCFGYLQRFGLFYTLLDAVICNLFADGNIYIYIGKIGWVEGGGSHREEECHPFPCYFMV